MTINAVTPKISWIGNDSTDTLSLTVDGSSLTFNANSEILVQQRVAATGTITTLVSGVDYDLTGGPVLSSSALPATLTRLDGDLETGYTWIVTRVTPVAQSVDLVTGGDFSASDIEAMGDKAIVILQEMKEKFDRAFLLSLFSSGVSGTLPDAQALNYLRWNAAANALENAASVDLTGTTVSSFIETLLDDANASAARSTLGLGALAVLNTIATALIDNDAVTYAKMQNISATSRILGRRSASSGDTEECTLSEILDFVGSAARGDLLRRGISAWERLPKGTAGMSLIAGADDPAYGYPSTLFAATAQATTSGTAFDFPSLPAGIRRITVMFDRVSLSGTDNILVQIGESGSGVSASGYSSVGGVNTGAGVGTATSTAGFIIFIATAARSLNGHMTITRISGNQWVASYNGSDLAGGTNVYNGGGTKGLPGELDRVRITRSGTNTFDGADSSVNIAYEF